MSEKNGTNLLVLVNTGTPTVPVYEAVACQRDATIERTTDPIDISCKDNRAMKVEPGRYSTTVSFDNLYISTDAGYLAMEAAMDDGTTILLAREEGGVVIETAEAVITSLSESFPDQDAAVVSSSFTINGVWTEVGT